MTTSNNDDRELEQYLAGKDVLTRQYKSVAGESPPPHIDEAILAASRKAVAAKPGRFMPPYFGRLDAPLAIAAVVMLSVLVIFNLPDETLMLQGSSEADRDLDEAAISVGTAVNIELAEDRMAEQEASSNANQRAESAEIRASTASPAITAPVNAPALEAAPQEDLSASVAADNAQTIVDMQKAMRMQTEEQIANSESARILQPPPEIVIGEAAQRDTYADSAPAEAGQTQFTACTAPRPQVCTMEYLPVCATRDTGIRCVTTPCDSAELVEFSNACNACGDPDVIGYAPGSCPATE